MGTFVFPPPFLELIPGRIPPMKFGYLEFRYNNRKPFDSASGKPGGATINIGDNIQSLAARALFQRLGIAREDMAGVNRDDLPNYRGSPVKLLMNGCFYPWCFPLPAAVTPVFFGFNTDDARVIRENRALFEKHQPIGCRDEATRALMEQNGIRAYVSGCITLTLPRRETTPQASCPVIAYGSGAGELPAPVLTRMPKRLLHAARLIYQREPVQRMPLLDEDVAAAEALAASYLALYRDSATLIVTPLLHVASPCLGLGLPVILVRKDVDARFTAIGRLIPVHTPEQVAGIDWQPSTLDLEPLKNAMAGIVGNLIADQPPAAADLDFLRETYARPPLAPPGGIKTKSALYRFLHGYWLRKP